jgi:DNA-binding transcriptional LysR family regulator
MDRLEAMSILLTTVEAGSLSAAARRLGMPLATVSRKVSDLEAHLRSRLFNRTSRRLTLTDGGRSYVEACKRILEEVTEAERAVAGEYSAPKGELIVTAPVVFGRLHVLPVITAFLKAHRDINVRLVLADRIVNLVEDHIDVAVRIGPLSDSGLIATRVGAIRQVVCGSPAYFAARGVPARPADLGAHDCITSDGLMSPDVWRFPAGNSAASKSPASRSPASRSPASRSPASRSPASRSPASRSVASRSVASRSVASVAIRSRLVVNAAEAAIDAAIAGLGVARVLSYQAVNAIQAGSLTVVLRDFEPAPWPVSLVYAGSGRLLPLKLRAFLDFAAPRLKAVTFAA